MTTNFTFILLMKAWALAETSVQISRVGGKHLSIKLMTSLDCTFSIFKQSYKYLTCPLQLKCLFMESDDPYLTRINFKDF